MTGAKKKLQGLMVPLAVTETLGEIVEIEREAYVELGADSTVSLSDVVSDALTNHVTAWLKKYGPIPQGAAERKEFVRRVAAKMRSEASDQLHGRQSA